MKYLLAWIVLLIALIQLWRKLRAGWRGMQGAAGHKPQRQDSQAMVPCHACGEHVPQSEAFYRAGRAYCCDAHARSAGQTASSAAPGDEQERARP